jgi:hypothetical protein
LVSKRPVISPENPMYAPSISAPTPQLVSRLLDESICFTSTWDWKTSVYPTRAGRDWTSGVRPLAEADGERLIRLVDGLDAVADVRELVELACAGRA